MSRREHITSQSYIDWLKSLGCLVYLPLSADGDLQDRISGLSLQLTGRGSMAWDSEQQMYHFKNPPSGNSDVATLTTNLSLSDFPNNSHTSLATGKRISTNGYWIPFRMGNNVPSVSPFTYNGTSNFSVFNNNINKFAYTLSTTERKTFYNGTLNGTYAAYAPYLPNSWGGFTLHIGALDGNGVNREYYVKDYMIFNTALDLTTIRKIQGYE